MRILTVGYEGISLSEFLDVLLAQGVRCIVDVREVPLSRKPGFSKTPLARALEEVGIQYVHERVLGTPKPIREALKSTKNWHEYEKSYLEFLLPREGHLVRIAALEAACLLCFEANPLECHRSLVAQRMHELNLIDEIQHLHPIKKARPSLALA
jgi:uncharacterized protein (DUF488 family)